MIEDRRIASLKVLLPLVIFTIASVALCFNTLAPGLAKDGEEREIEYGIPKHLPLKIRIKKDKEQKVKDLANDQWLRDFELEITNTSEKPIYFLELWLVFPDIIEPNGGPNGIPLRFGRMAFVNFKTRPSVEDAFINPGQTYVYAIPVRYQQGWNRHKANGHLMDPKKVVLRFIQLSFGDGTGFDTPGGVPYPYRQRIQTSGSVWQPIPLSDKGQRYSRSPAWPLGMGRVSFESILVTRQNFH